MFSRIVHLKTMSPKLYIIETKNNFITSQIKWSFGSNLVLTVLCTGTHKRAEVWVMMVQDIVLT